MSFFDRFRAAKTMAAIYDREYAAILKQDYDTLVRLAPRKAQTLTALTHEDVSPDELTRLQNLAARNQRLLEATSKGIRSVTDRLAALKERKPEFQTYGPGGQVAPMTPKSLTMKRNS
ncbi:flagellar protein FlgN [Celeribacter marinus]|uniref:Uncharacterized protein n=1 Tax=Celeribacter marinus TaxID=1397108 RepID=A0A0N7HIM7_9RHOB|nr:flagellar protein FlgN [Celeribacter marinus]ALI55653.1 hypothetical protein IMCC12053_1706 [Celeribacter marinus]SFK25341.1 hypothetical protein SAMN05444421_102257 [Celeribacter marinus]